MDQDQAKLHALEQAVLFFQHHPRQEYHDANSVVRYAETFAAFLLEAGRAP